MSSLTVTGMAAFQTDLQSLLEVPDTLLVEMGEAGARVIVKKIQSKGKAMGVHRTGVTIGSIKAKKPVQKPGGMEVVVTPIGINKDGKRNGEVAFVNNYGKIGQSARPFFTDAVPEAENESVDAAERVYHEYLNSKNL